MHHGWQDWENNEYGDGFDGNPDFSEDSYDEPPLGPDRNRRYREAYGDYHGGYGPGGPYTPPRFAPYPPGPSGAPGPMGMRRPPQGGFRRPPGPPPEGPCGPLGPLPGFRRPQGPMGPPGPNFPRGPSGGFGPGQGYGRSTDDLVIKFLTRCGLSIDVLKALPSRYLAMMTPRHCEVCIMDLSTFDQARLHYNSKNHNRNQRKWLSVNGLSIKTTYNKEAPFKARELYCELCDVHITSKVHADSHYAGKPHRAIVEGRKMPKNAELCQPGMKTRMDQLIKREKRCLKALVENPPALPPQVKDMKPIPPELVCNICKTSVTNTEQMTMHLNGKKHLTKEKQHILNMMNGKANNHDGEAGENGNKDADKTGGDGVAEGNGNDNGNTDGGQSDAPVKMEDDGQAEGYNLSADEW